MARGSKHDTDLQDGEPNGQPGEEATLTSACNPFITKSDVQASKHERYGQMVQRVRQVMQTMLRPGAAVAVVNKGDDQLLQLEGLQGWHFPQMQSGEYAGHHPGSSAEAIVYLETVRAKGADYLVIPQAAFWWLEHYSEFREYLSHHYTKVVDDADTCVIYQLTRSNDNKPDSAMRRQQVVPSNIPIFDLDSYRRDNPAVHAREREKNGLPTCATGLSNSHPLFDADWYLEQNPDLAKADIDPFEHYLAYGAKQGRSPHPLFDAKFYWKAYPDAVLAGQPALEHYLTIGWKKGYRPNPKFDPAFYLSSYPDVAASGVEPLTHFVRDGLKEGRVGSPDDVLVEPYRAAFPISRAPGAYRTSIDQSVRAIAFHLPQFHPIRENSRWWGKGFTEWTNVRRGTRQFRGHYQPHVPSTLGYYDLADRKTLARQAELAQANGIHGFCFYYYWFAGKVLLDRPLRQMMATGKPAFPFCICWANENWTRRWDGMEQEILIAQKHTPEDDLEFLRNIEPMLTHPNYIRIGGRPLLLLYRPGILPDARATANRWRNYFRARGHGELYLAMPRSFHDRTPPDEYGFDAAIQFPPHVLTRPFNHQVHGKKASFQGRIHDYESTKRTILEDLTSCSDKLRLYPGVMPSWDNTARRLGLANIWINSSPESYYDWLLKAVDHVRQNFPADERLVFINAWNEWAEGCHLEPDRKHGHAWLNATNLALRADAEHCTVAGPARIADSTANVRRNQNTNVALEAAFVSHDAYPHGAQYCLLTLVTWMKEAGLVNPRFILAGPGPLTSEFARLGPVLRLDLIAESHGTGEARLVRILRTFCGSNLSAVYINSAAAGHVCQWTKNLDVPHIAHVHELEESIRRWVGKDKMAAIRNSADLVVAASGPVAHNLQTEHKIDGKLITTIQESIKCTGMRQVRDPAKQRCKVWLGLHPKAKIVLGCGTTDWRKGPDLFIKVAAKVRRMYQHPVQFVWVGGPTRPGEMQELHKCIVAEQLTDTVIFAGQVTTPLVYMVAADLFLLPSREDPFPLVCLEAADCGLPIVCFADAGGMPEFVKPDCGAVVPYLDVNAMSAQVLAFLEDHAKLRQCGNHARDTVRSNFDVSVKGKEIFQAIDALCAQRTIVRRGARR